MARLRFAFAAIWIATVAHAAPPEAAISADLDGDGRPEAIAVDGAGTLSVRSSDGKSWGELKSPPVTGARQETTIVAVASSHGRFVHVYVDRQTRRPVPLPDRLLAFVKALQ